MDFGTTHSGMAWYDGQQLRMLPLNPRNATDNVTPTMLYITNEQIIHFGREATNAYFEQNLGRPSKSEKVWVGEISQTFAEIGTFIKDVYIWVDVLSPGRLFLSFKSDLSDASYTGTAIGRFFYTLEEITATYLYIAKSRAERALGQPVDAVVLGRPVHFHADPAADALAQARLLDATLRAGYQRVYFEYEPVAAAHYYEMSITQPQQVLVFDFGGGTLDITIMRLGERGRGVLATGGVPLAGDLFDRKIVRAKIPQLFGEGSLYRSLDKKLAVPGWIYEAFGDWRTLLTLQQPENLHALRTIAPVADQRRALEALIKLVTSNYSLKLFEVVEEVKRRLSEKETAIIRLQGDGFTIRQTITRAEFEGLIRPEYHLIEQEVERTLRAAGLRAEQIDVVIRTGGSSQIPLFQRMLAQKFGPDKVRAIDTFGSVTAGLGVIAHRIAQGEVEKPVYTQASRAMSTGSGRANIPPINLDLLKTQIDWRENAQGRVAGRGLLLLTKNYELTVSELPTPLPATLTLADADLPPPEALQVALCATLDEPLLLITSAFRLVLVTLRALRQQQAAGLTVAQLYGFARAEQICLVQRWAAIYEHDQLILISTQGYGRRFDMTQIRPAIEGPTPTKIYWTLPGWPRLVLGAASGTAIALVTSSGRGLRIPVATIRRTGTRLIHKAKSDDLVFAAGVDEQQSLWLLTTQGYAKSLPAAAIPLGEGEAGAVVVRRRGELIGGVGDGVASVAVISNQQLRTLDPSATPRAEAEPLSMHKALTLAQGEVVLGVMTW